MHLPQKFSRPAFNFRPKKRDNIEGGPPGVLAFRTCQAEVEISLGIGFGQAPRDSVLDLSRQILRRYLPIVSFGPYYAATEQLPAVRFQVERRVETGEIAAV